MHQHNGIIQVRPGLLMRVDDRYAGIPARKPKIQVNELERIAFMVKRDGIKPTIAFVEQTKRSYRRAVVNPDNLPALTYASLPEYREGYISSYLQFKRFLEAIQRSPEAWKTILPL
jgi:hypothetical protein